jgi:hypothetical protein
MRRVHNTTVGAICLVAAIGAWAVPAKADDLKIRSPIIGKRCLRAVEIGA